MSKSEQQPIESEIVRRRLLDREEENSIIKIKKFSIKRNTATSNIKEETMTEDRVVKQKFIKQNLMANLQDKRELKYRMMIQSLFVGMAVGIVVVLYRILGEKLLEAMVELYQGVKRYPSLIFGIIAILILASVLVSYCIQIEPDISGSGIPQVEGVITGKITVNWLRVLVYKFIGGIMALAGGLSVGREGPSIQLGAVVGEGIAKKLNRNHYEQKHLITSGASAGLAAAFNAPLAGVMFAIEEVHKNFSPVVVMSAMISAVTADFVSKSILGIQPALQFGKLIVLPLKYYWLVICLGIFVGSASYIFNNGLRMAKNSYKKLPISLKYKIMIPFLFSAIIGMTMPVLIGGGYTTIMKACAIDFGMTMVLVMLLVKYIFTFISFGSGVPGGIFFPLLALGALLGNIFALISVQVFGLPEEFLINFAVLAMAGHFAAIVKAPITSIVLVYELTGSFEQLLPLAVVVFVAMLTSDILGVTPVYDMLLEDIIQSRGQALTNESEGKTVIEMAVHLGSQIDGKTLSEVSLPEDCLIVAIVRGNEEILPRGQTKIMMGDLLHVMVGQDQESALRERLQEIIQVE